MSDAHTGGCLCGAIRYRITGAPVEALYCHCRMCRRAHGAPVVAWFETADRLPRYAADERPKPAP